MRKGDLLDVRTAETYVHAVVVSSRSHRVSVLDTTGRTYSFPKYYANRVVRPFRGTPAEREMLVASVGVRA